MSTNCKVCGAMTSVSPTYVGTFVKCRICLMQSSTPAGDDKRSNKPHEWDEDNMRSFVDEFLGEKERQEKEALHAPKERVPRKSRAKVAQQSDKAKN